MAKLSANPENAEKVAALAVQGVNAAWDINLDYSAESLELLDQVIENMRNENSNVTEVGGSLVGLGCYLGEVMVRNLSGVWKNTKDTHGFPVGVSISSSSGPARIINPIGKVIKRFNEGKEHDLPSFYTSIMVLGVAFEV